MVWESYIFYIANHSIVLHDWLAVLGNLCLFSCQKVVPKPGYCPTWISALGVTAINLNGSLMIKKK